MPCCVRWLILILCRPHFEVARFARSHAQRDGGETAKKETLPEFHKVSCMIEWEFRCELVEFQTKLSLKNSF